MKKVFALMLSLCFVFLLVSFVAVKVVEKDKEYQKTEVKVSQLKKELVVLEKEVSKKEKPKIEATRAKEPYNISYNYCRNHRQTQGEKINFR